MFALNATATILHADLDAFYASVEQRDDPTLRGRPVIVGGGVVLAASYEARALGVRTAMGGSQARRLCPHAAVVSPRMSAYSDASKAVFEIFEDMSPLVEALSIEAVSHGYNVVLGHAHGRADEALALTTVLETRHCDAIVLLGDVQAPGKRRMTAPEWARGLRSGGPVRFD